MKNPEGKLLFIKQMIDETVNVNNKPIGSIPHGLEPKDHVRLHEEAQRYKQSNSEACLQNIFAYLQEAMNSTDK